MPATQGNSTEDFLILAGTQRVLTQGPQSLDSLGTPEENAAVGIDLPEFASDR